MTLSHLASSAFFVGAIGFAGWAIVDSFRREWAAVRRTFGLPPASDAHIRQMAEADPRPADRPPVVGGAFGEAR